MRGRMCASMRSILFARQFWTSTGLCKRLQFVISRGHCQKAIEPAKLDAIAASIENLTLLETSKLVKMLKERLEISEMPMAAPMPANAPALQPVAAQEQEEEKQLFTIKLESFDSAQKAKAIKEVKALLGLNLVDAKKLVESAPKVLKENVPKEDANKIKESMLAVGAKVSLE